MFAHNYQIDTNDRLYTVHYRENQFTKGRKMRKLRVSFGMTNWGWVHFWLNWLFVWPFFFTKFVFEHHHSLKKSKRQISKRHWLRHVWACKFLSCSASTPMPPNAQPRVRVSLSFSHKVHTPTISLSVRSLVCSVVTTYYARSSKPDVKYKSGGWHFYF